MPVVRKGKGGQGRTASNGTSKLFVLFTPFDCLVCVGGRDGIRGNSCVEPVSPVVEKEPVMLLSTLWRFPDVKYGGALPTAIANTMAGISS